MGMGNCFEAARLCEVPHTVYASSVAVNGLQSHYGDRLVHEDGRELCDNYLIDNARLVEEFGVEFPPFEDRVRQTINDVRRAHDLPAIDC